MTVDQFELRVAVCYGEVTWRVHDQVRMSVQIPITMKPRPAM